MTNEQWLLVRMVIELGFVLFMFRFGKAGLVAALVVNLLLVTLFGGMLVYYYGYVTNAGNLFYAAVFFTLALMNEHFGAKQAYKALMVSLCALLLFIVIGQVTAGLSGPAAGFTGIDESLQTVFGIVPQIAFASVFAYLVAGVFYVWFYDKLKAAMRGDKLWLRAIIPAVTAQILDSCIFFSAVLAGKVSGGILWQTIVLGIVLKSVVAVASVPCLYFSRSMRQAHT